MSFLNLGNVRINTRSNTDAELLKNTTYQHSDQNGMLYSEPAYETPVHHEVSGASIVANYETASAFYQYVPTAVSIHLQYLWKCRSNLTHSYHIMYIMFILSQYLPFVEHAYWWSESN